MPTKKQLSNKDRQKVFVSRRIILDTLKSRGFNVEDYEGFNSHEISTLVDKHQLDMLITNENTKKKVLVKYFMPEKLKSAHISNLVEDIYNLEDILDQDEELIIVIKDKVSDSFKEQLSKLYSNDKIFVNIFNINNFLFNIFNVSLVPKHIVMTDSEKSLIKKKYNITNDEEFPDISRYDPVSIALGLRPGQLCHIIRPSVNSIVTDYYRLCHN
jgi:DNA-directed RNA polymerase I, II, and III subunit RPABC1